MKIFAYDTLKHGIGMEQIQPFLKEEALHAWDLYKKGIIRENYMRTDRPGALIVLECADLKEAKKIISDLPLVKAGLIEFEFITVGPFIPWENLFAK